MFKLGNNHTANIHTSSPVIIRVGKKIITTSLSIVGAELFIAFFFFFNPKLARKLGIGKNAHPVREK